MQSGSSSLHQTLQQRLLSKTSCEEEPHLSTSWQSLRILAAPASQTTQRGHLQHAQLDQAQLSAQKVAERGTPEVGRAEIISAIHSEMLTDVNEASTQPQTTVTGPPPLYPRMNELVKPCTR